MVTTQELYEFVAYAKRLFAQSDWTDDQWAAFGDALKHQPAPAAREAIKRHFQGCRWRSPTPAAVVAECGKVRFGDTPVQPRKAEPGPAEFTQAVSSADPSLVVRMAREWADARNGFADLVGSTSPKCVPPASVADVLASPVWTERVARELWSLAR